MAGRGTAQLLPETFRARAVLRAAVLMADSLWIAVLCALLVGRGATPSAIGSAFFFIVLFTACAAFYERLAVRVGERSLTLCSVGEQREVAFSDILRVDVVPGLVGTTYSIRTRLGALRFDSLLEDHERLCSLIVRRAGLTAAR